MNKIMISLGVFLFLFSFVIAQDEPNVGVGDEDVEKLQGAIDYIPIDDSGEIDYDKYKPFRTKADERIEKINKYIGPITRVLWGVELSLSWIFIFSFVLWILLIELIVVPMSEILDFNVWGSLFGAGIVATLAMQGFGKDFVVWIESLMTQWWVGFIVLVFAVVIGMVYSIFANVIGKKVEEAKEESKKAQTERDRDVLHADANISKERLKK